MSDTLVEFAPAKLNLFLHVLGRLSNGYHDLESLAVFLDFGDTLTLSPVQEFGLLIQGETSTSLIDEDVSTNLIVKAAHALADLFGKPLDFSLSLDKQIPVAAGLGGGSADAAACIRLLCRHWNEDWKTVEVAAIAKSLGADIPVCLHSKSCFMRGIGDELEFVDVPKLDMVLVNPRKGVSTKTIFQSLDLKPGDVRRKAMELDGLEFDQIMSQSSNDLQPAASDLEPSIDTCLQAMGDIGGADFVRMTGSGATCFAIYKNAEITAENARKLAEKLPFAWVKATPILEEKTL